MKIYQKGSAVCVQVYVQPRASSSAVVGEHGDGLKIRIAAPPVEGEANEELERYLAKLVGTARSNVSVVSGAGSRHKTVCIENVELATVQAAIDQALKSAK